ncbi:MAG: helix-turn-helix domain-containing protein, partial [Proteobacteria bacterium]|nr:helix-turn-helix domain-containing protein [Pseudomonadota bacterium]
MAGLRDRLDESNMPHALDAIRSYSLFGESSELPDVMHCETIAARSALHDWELAPHRHTRLHQVLLLGVGGGVAHLEGESHALHPGTLLNVPPGTVHGFRFAPGSDGFVATFADDLLDEILVGVGDVRRTLERPGLAAADEPIATLLRQIWSEFTGRGGARALVLRGLCATLLGRTARALAGAVPIEDAHPKSRLFSRFESLLEARYAEHWRVADYARALAVSPTHLSRVTRAMTGGSALRLIDARVMREARRHLAYTSMSVTTIAYTLGYSDPALFTRVFTRALGVSPRAFRARLGASAAPGARPAAKGSAAGAKRRADRGS